MQPGRNEFRPTSFLQNPEDQIVAMRAHVSVGVVGNTRARGVNNGS